jgi:effector-binding domain-containing protein
METTTDLEFAEVSIPPALAVQMTGHSAADPAAISAAMRKVFESVSAFVQRHNLTMNAPPRAIYTAYDARGVTFVVAMPVEAGPAAYVDEPSLSVSTLPGARTYRFTHHGPYADLAQTYGRITAFMKEKGLLKSDADWARYMPMWEEYCNNPCDTAAADLLTHIYLPA